MQGKTFVKTREIVYLTFPTLGSYTQNRELFLCLFYGFLLIFLRHILDTP